MWLRLQMIGDGFNTSQVKVRLMRFSFKTLLQHRQNTNQPTMHQFEVAGAFDAFTSLEEIESNLDWMEVLAASWGVHYIGQTEKEIMTAPCAKSSNQGTQSSNSALA
jgi:hypothetical protein